MRQRINLYWPEFKPEFRWLNVGTMLVVWLLTLLIVVLVTMRLSVTVQKQSAVLNQAQERTIQLDEELAIENRLQHRQNHLRLGKMAPALEFLAHSILL